MVLAVLRCKALGRDDGGGFMAFFMVDRRAALWQNSSQSSPLSPEGLVSDNVMCSRGMIDDGELM